MLVAAGPTFNSYLTSRGASDCKQIPSSSSVITVSSSSNSSTGSKYNLIKSVTASINRVKTSVQNTFLQITTPRDISTASSKVDLKSLAIPPKNSHRSPSFSDGEDSLKSELIHFKPINAAPKTPNRITKNKILRVPSIRPPSTPSNSFSPCPSPFTPIDPKSSSRVSAFSVFSSLADEEPKLSTVIKLSPKSPNKRGRKRKIPATSIKIEQLLAEPKDIETEAKVKRPRKQNALNEDTSKHTIVKAPTRVTRSRKSDDPIKTDDFALKNRIKQEHEDFEFAKKIQDKLNKTNGSLATKTWPKIELPARGYNTRSRKN